MKKYEAPQVDVIVITNEVMTDPNAGTNYVSTPGIGGTV